jgi:hypothetical protein
LRSALLEEERGYLEKFLSLFKAERLFHFLSLLKGEEKGEGLYVT